MAELSAFAGCAPVACPHPDAVAQPVEPLSAISVTAWRGQAAALADTAWSRFGLELPANARWTEREGLAAIWAGPDHWTVQRAGRTPLLRELAPLAAHAGLIDVSDARAVLRLSGPGAREMLAGLLPLDLHPRAFAPGHVATTLAAHMTVQVRQIDAARYDLACLRSYAGSLWRALELCGAGRITMRLEPAA